MLTPPLYKLTPSVNCQFYIALNSDLEPVRLKRYRLEPERMPNRMELKRLEPEIWDPERLEPKKLKP